VNHQYEIYYLTMEDFGIRMLDSLTMIGGYNTAGHSYDIEVDGIYAYVADEFYFSIFDCSQALGINPVEVTISNNGNDIIRSWRHLANALNYNVYYQNEPYFEPTGAPQAVVLPPDANWTDVEALNQGKKYYLMIVEY
jgi:hypothetical protein